MMTNYWIHCCYDNIQDLADIIESAAINDARSVRAWALSMINYEMCELIERGVII